MKLQDQSPIPLKNELIFERNASLQMRPSVEALKREASDIELQIRQLQVKELNFHFVNGNII